jgi:predicted MPP superfamily phosphohydrolase
MNSFADCHVSRRPPADRRPGDRFYSIVHWTFMLAIVGMYLGSLLVQRWMGASRAGGFRVAIGAMLCMNVLWWSVADRRFARHVASPRGSLLLRALAAAFSLLLNAPLIWMVLEGELPAFLSLGPTWYSASIMLWQMGLVVAMPVVAALRISGIAAAALWRRAACRPPPPAPDPARRAFLRTSFATVPIALLGGGVVLSRLQEGQWEINRHRLPAPWLPDRLRGLTLTQITDLHLGRHFRPSMLPALVEAANRLDSDIVVITGDIVDHSNDPLEAALDAFRHLTHRHGIFLCIGNHDEIDDRAEFIRRTRAVFPLLLNERRRLDIGSERVTVAGLDWTRLDEATPRRAGHPQMVERMLREYDRSAEGPVIALAHHPHAWDALSACGVPLTLAGHTHGGQLMLTPPDRSPEWGAGSVLFRYLRGFYRREGSTLFVNRGVGNWFPLRLHSPAEIVQIQLV